MSSAPLWILAVALVSRDGCGSDAPKSATGSAAVATAGSAAPSLAPAAGTAGSAAPTTTTMSRDAQAKLDKLVGAKPGTHKPIKPTPEPQPAAGSGSAAPKPKPRNQFPGYGRAMSEQEMFELPNMDLERDKESWDYGATVRQGQSPAPRYVAYRCVTKPTCHGWAEMGSDWKIIGWWGTDY